MPFLEGGWIVNACFSLCSGGCEDLSCSCVLRSDEKGHPVWQASLKVPKMEFFIKLIQGDFFNWPPLNLLSVGR